jgi:hypothetical protein
MRSWVTSSSSTRLQPHCLSGGRPPGTSCPWRNADAALALLPKHLGSLHVILGKVQAAGVAQRAPVILVLAPEGRVACATVLADLRDTGSGRQKSDSTAEE